jgi:hypothetical protein
MGSDGARGGAAKGGRRSARTCVRGIAALAGRGDPSAQVTPRRERHIRQEGELVTELERQGRDTAAARNLLAIFEDLRNQYLAERDRLLRAS